MISDKAVHDVLGCPVTETHFTQWSSLLVNDVAPFFLSQDIELPDETLILTRKGFTESQFDLCYRDSYTLWAVNKEAHTVAMLTSESFDMLPVQTQQQLLKEQCQLGRGQVYQWKKVAPFLQICIQEAETRCVSFAGEQYFVLDKKIWSLLTSSQRRDWLIAFITADNASNHLSNIHLPGHPIIQRLAGTFATTSGANCFSTTLASITKDEQTALTIAGFWLHPEPFLEGLAKRGYTYQLNETPLEPNLQDAVLIWQDESGIAQHACYLIGDGLVINKNSQGWFSPRQLLRLQTLLDDWQEEGLKIAVYRRAS